MPNARPVRIKKQSPAEFAKRVFPAACIANGLPAPVEELRFHPTRRWRFDYSWPDRKVAVECEGGIYTQGRHSRGKGMENDMDKYNSATALGWRLIRVTPARLNAGQTFEWIRQAMESAA